MHSLPVHTWLHCLAHVTRYSTASSTAACCGVITTCSQGVWACCHGHEPMPAHGPWLAACLLSRHQCLVMAKCWPSLAFSPPPSVGINMYSPYTVHEQNNANTAPPTECHARVQMHHSNRSCTHAATIMQAPTIMPPLAPGGIDAACQSSMMPARHCQWPPAARPPGARQPVREQPAAGHTLRHFHQQTATTPSGSAKHAPQTALTWHQQAAQGSLMSHMLAACYTVGGPTTGSSA